MTGYPNLDRLIQADPDNLTSRQLQVLGCRIDYKTPARGLMQVDKDARMAAAVPALLAHIDELYGENDRLRAYTDTTKYHQDNHAAAVRDLEALKARTAEALNLLDALDRTSNDLHAENLVDRVRNLLGGAR